MYQQPAAGVDKFSSSCHFVIIRWGLCLGIYIYIQSPAGGAGIKQDPTWVGGESAPLYPGIERGSEPPASPYTDRENMKLMLDNEYQLSAPCG